MKRPIFYHGPGGGDVYSAGVKRAPPAERRVHWYTWGVHVTDWRRGGRLGGELELRFKNFAGVTVTARFLRYEAHAYLWWR